MPRCENVFCIFQENYACTLGEANHDEHGMCTDCMLMPLPNSIINRMKELKKEAWNELRAKYSIDNQKT